MSSNTADFLGAVKTTGRVCPGTRLGNQLKKIGVNTNSKIRLPRVQVRLKQRQVSPTEKKWLILTTAIEDLNNSLTTTPRILMSFISILASLEKTVPMSRLHMRPFQWYLKNHWKYPQSLDKKIPCSEILTKTSDMVEKSKKRIYRLSPSCRGTQSPVVHRCICQGLG